MVKGVQSGCGAVLVNKSTKDVHSVDSPNLAEVGRCQLTVDGGHAKVDAPMGAGGVVVPHVDGEHLLEVPRARSTSIQELGS
jgi:hypothetical protein